MTLADRERAKYEVMWAVPEYRAHSPGEMMLPMFTKMVGAPQPGATLLDIGAGTGRAARRLAETGWNVTMLDHVEGGIEVDLPLIICSIFEPWPTQAQWDVGYCCDVMEHIPPQEVDAALTHILAHCRRVFFNIHFGPDNFGKVIGHPLHLTVQPFTWWVETLAQRARLIHARDLLGFGAFLVERHSS